MQLEIRGISKAYPGGAQALREVSLTIPVGLHGLFGARGAGKSTLMRILATVQAPDRGSIRLGGLDLLGPGEEPRKALGYLPPEFPIHPQVSAQALLDHFALLRGLTRHWLRREVVEALLRRVNLWDERQQKVGAYSGGMRQRFAVAVALLGDPKLLLVDEPTAGLEPAEGAEVLALLGDLGKERIVLFATHLVEDLAPACSGVAILDGGRIRQNSASPSR